MSDVWMATHVLGNNGYLHGAPVCQYQLYHGFSTGRNSECNLPINADFPLVFYDAQQSHGK